jgi:hypothetical protein
MSDPPHPYSEPEYFSLPFPNKLALILEKEDPAIVQWSKNGHSFRIVDYEQFTEIVLPKYFSRKISFSCSCISYSDTNSLFLTRSVSKLASFQRQLNLYGFKKRFRGEDKDCYFHPLFLKDRKDLLPLLKRPPTKNRSKRKKTQSGSEEEGAAQEEQTQEDDHSLNRVLSTLQSQSRSSSSQLAEFTSVFKKTKTSENEPQHQLSRETILQPGSLTFVSSGSSVHPHIHHPYHLPIPYSGRHGSSLLNPPVEFFSPSLSNQISVHEGFPDPNLPYQPYFPYPPWGYYPLRTEVDPDSQISMSSSLLPCPISSSFVGPTSSSPTIPINQSDPELKEDRESKDNINDHEKE